MSCLIKFLKAKFSGNKYVALDKDDLTSSLIENECPTALEKQKECCVCMEKINEKKLSCGHNIHIICIIKSKKTECPMCFTNLSQECMDHIKNCKNKKCFCKITKEITETERIMAHDIITRYISNLRSNQNINRKKLEILMRDNEIKNYKSIVDLYV